MTSSSFPFPIPLAYDTVYYVESADNEPLNQTMRQIAAAGQPLFANSKMQPFPFKLLCLTREELAADRLTSGLADKYDPALVADTIANLRECLHADTGGTLTARCLPKFDGKVREDDRAVFMSESFGTTLPEKALDKATSFAREVADENFSRLSGTSYYHFLCAQEEAHSYSPRRSSGSTMGFMIARQDPQEILQKMERRIASIRKMIDENTNNDDVFGMLEENLKKLKDNYKMNTFCKLFVSDDKIYLKISEEERKEILFGRDHAKALYVFYLQQIQRAKRNPEVSQYLSREELEDYKEELLKMYQFFSGRICTMNDIQSLWDDTKGYAFRDATSSIRTYFEREFDVATIEKNEGKSYFCTIKKGKNSVPRYGANLDVDDFDLDQFNYKKIKPIRL